MSPNLSAGPPDAAELLDELERLRGRIAILEAERDEYAQQNAELFVLQQVFSTINSTLEINDILSMVLRGVVEALKFKRVMLFDVVEDDTIIRRLECDDNGTVNHAVDPHEFRPDSALADVSHGNLQLAYGTHDDPDSPLEDRAARSASPRWSRATSCAACSTPTIRRATKSPRINSA